jgi:GntR family transcriptional regulator
MPRQTWRELSALLEGRIRDGTYLPGSKLPTMSALIAEGLWSKSTIERAYRDLAERGVVVARSRVGTVVRDRSPIRVPLSRYGKVLRPGGSKGPWETATAEQGLDGRMISTGVETVEAPEAVRASLGLPPGAPVVRRSRHAILGEDVVQVQHAWYPDDIAQAADLGRPGKIEGGVFGAMVAAGLLPHEADEIVTARMPSKEEAASLSIGTAVPVLLVERVLRDRSGRVLELLQIIGTADRLQLIYDRLPIKGLSS